MTLPAGRPGQVVRIDEAAGTFTIEREFDAARDRLDARLRELTARTRTA